MTGSLGYPANLIAVEKGLKQMPHLQTNPNQLPDRRADIVCYGKNIHPQFNLYPLLLIECKAVKLTPKVINQVSGYNHFLSAYFIAVANQKEIETGWFDSKKGSYQFVSYLPSYQQLMESCR